MLRRQFLFALVVVYLSIAMLAAAPFTFPRALSTTTITPETSTTINPQNPNNPDSSIATAAYLGSSQEGSAGQAPSSVSKDSTSSTTTSLNSLPTSGAVSVPIHSTETVIPCVQSSIAISQVSTCSIYVTDTSLSPTTPVGIVLVSLGPTSTATGTISNGGCGLGTINTASSTCSVTFTASGSGTAMITAFYGGDAAHFPSQGQFTISVDVHSTATIASCVPSSVVVSQASTCTAYVTDLSASPTTPFGDILFSLNSTSTATGSLSACSLGPINSAESVCAVNFNPTGSGTALIDAVYSGDAGHSVSTGQSTVTVSGATGVAVHPTTTSVACSPASVAVNQPSTCTVSVTDTVASPTSPTNYVLFSLNNTSTARGSFSPIACGASAVNPSTSSCSVSFTPSGSGTAFVTATYGGDAAHSPSSAESTVSALVHSTTTSVVCSPASVSVNEPSTCTVSVTDNSAAPVTPTGIVLFSLNGTSTATGSFNGVNNYCGLGRVNVATASCSVNLNPSGHGVGLVDATYGGDPVHSISSSQSTVSVLVHSTTTTVLCSPASVAVNVPSTCTVSVVDNSVTPVSPSSIVLFSLDSASTATGTFNGPNNYCGLGIVNPSTSSCSVTFTPSGSGTGLVVATYGGDTIHSVSSSRFTVTVPAHPTRATVSCTPSSLVAGQSSSCTMFVRDTSSAPVTPSGAVLFILNNTSTATGTFNGGSDICGLVGINSTSSNCSVNFVPSGSGTSLVNVYYGGDLDHTVSSGQFIVTVPAHSVTASVSCSPSPVAVGQSSTCTGFVRDTSSSPVSPPAGILFSLNATSTAVGAFGPPACALSTVNSTTGSCAVNFSATGSGTALVDVFYDGDPAHPVSSGRFTLSVSGSRGAPVHPTMTSVSCVPSSIDVSRVTTCTASVTDISSGPTAPSATVIFSLNGTSTAAGIFSPSTCGLSAINSAESLCSVNFTPSGFGTAFVDAHYGGDAAHSVSQSNFIMTVHVDPTRIPSLQCSPTYIAVNQASTCTVYVTDTSASPTAPSGIVLISLNGTSTATGSISNGGCTLAGLNSATSGCSATFTDSGSGTAFLTAFYGGDAAHFPTLGEFTVSVPVHSTTTTISCVPSSMAVNQVSTCSVYVTDTSASPTAPSGIVLISLNSTSTATGSVTNGGCGLGAISSATSSCAISFTALGSGTAFVTALYGGNAAHSGSSSFTVAVSPHTTTTSVSCTPASGPVNSTSDCTVSVTDNSGTPTVPSGAILLSLAGTSSASGTFSSGGTCGLGHLKSATSICTSIFTPSSSGTAVINADYSGDSAHTASSTSFTVAVSSTPPTSGIISVPIHSTTTVVSCVPSSVVVSQPSTCTAYVTDLSASPTTPSGDILFSLNSTSTATGSMSACGLGPINSAESICSINLNPSGSGTAFVTAVYSGDTAHSPSQGQFTVTISGAAGVAADPTTTSVACSPASIAVTQPSTCTVSVTDTLASPTSPSNYVMLILNSTSTASGSFGPIACGLNAVNPSTSSCSVSFTASGTGVGVVDAIYGGDASHSVSSGQFTVSVLVHSTTTSVVCSPSSVSVNGPSTCTVSVTDNSATPITPSGIVLFGLNSSSTATGYFNGGNNDCGLGRVNSATSSCSVNFNPSGSGTGVVDANYAGDNVHSVSSGQSTVSVLVHTTATSVVCSPASVPVGQPSTCTVSVTDNSVTPVTPTGIVIFSLNSTSTATGNFNGGNDYCGLGTVNPSTSSCSVNFTPSGYGVGLVVAIYSADPVHSISSSRYTVNVPVGSIRTSVSCSPSSLAVTQTSTCTVSVRDTSSSPVTPSGIVLLGLNSTSTATGNFNGGSNYCSLSGINSTTSNCSANFNPSGSGTALVNVFYSGDTVHSVSSGRFTIIVPVHSTTTVVSCSPSSVAVSGFSSCTAFVRDTSSVPVAPTGDVLVSLNSTSTATGNFNGGNSFCGLSAVNTTTSSCSVNFSPTGSGTGVVDAVYSRDTVHLLSSGQFTVTVSGSLGAPVHPTSTSVSCVPSLIGVGQASTCTAYVTDTSSGPTTPSGLVLFSLNNTSTATGSFYFIACGLAAVNSATSSCSVGFTASGAGTAFVTSLYGGDAAHSPSLGRSVMSILIHSTTTAVGGSVAANVAVGMSPWGVAYDSSNGYVYVTNFSSNTVSVISGTTVVATIPVGSHPAGVGYDSGNGYVYVTNYNANTVSVINGTTNTVVATIPVGASPSGVAYNTRNGYVYVTSANSVIVTVISGTTVVTQISIGHGTDLIAYDSGNGYVYATTGQGNSVSVIDGTVVLATISVQQEAFGVAYNSGNGFVYVTNANSNTVSVISGTTVVATIPVGSIPLFVAYDSGNGYVYVTNSGSNSTSVISGTTILSKVQVGTTPYGVAYNAQNGYVYVADFGSNNVNVISTTTLTLSCVPSSMAVGQASTCTAYVTDTSASPITPSGLVLFSLNNTSTSTGSFYFIACGLATLNSATSTCSVSFTASGAGTALVTALYAGDAAHSPSQGQLTVPVQGHPTTTTVSCVPSSVAVGQVSTCTAFVTDTSASPITPSGLVLFSLNNTSTATGTFYPIACGLGAVNSATSTCSVSFTSSGSGDGFVTALYGGDRLHYASPGQFNVSVTVHSTTTTISCVPSSIAVNQVSTCTVFVTDASSSPTTPSGVLLVSLSNTSTAAGSVYGGGCGLGVINSATSSCSVSFTASGSGTVCLIALYDGDSAHSGSSSFCLALPTDFTFSTSPATAAVLAGQTATSTVTVTGVNGFTDTVNLSVSISPSTGLTCTLSSPSVSLSSTTTTGSSTLSCSGSALFGGLGPSSYTVTVTGTGATSGKTHSATFTVTVEDFGLSASPTTVSPTVGVAGTSTITVGPLPVTGIRFSGTVSFSVATNSTSLSCTTPTSVTGGGPTTLSCTGSVAGNYNATVTGTSSNLSHTVSVIYHVIATDFTISASPATAAVLAGQAATSTITVTGQNGFTDTVNLATSISPSTGLTCTLSPASVSLSSSTTSATSTLSCSGSALFGGLGPSAYTVTVTGTGVSSNKSHSTTFTVTVEDFGLSASPTSVSPTVGVAGTSTITVGPLPVTGIRFSGTVSFTVTTNSTNLSCTNPASVTGAGSTTLSCTGSAAGNYNATVTGTSSILSHSVSVIYHILPTDFTISVNPTSATVLAGQPATTNVNVTGLNGFADNVNLSTSVGCGVLCTPSLTCTLSPTSLTLSSTTKTATSTLSCSGGAIPPIGGPSYTVTVTGTGVASGKTHSTTFTVTVQDFALVANPTSVSPTVGVAGTSTISLGSFEGGFSRTVMLTVTTNSTNLSCFLNPTSIGFPGSSILSCTGNAAGNYNASVTGTSSSLSHSVSVIYHVLATDFTISVNPTSATVLAGQPATTNVNVTGLNGFADTVNLSYSATVSCGPNCTQSLTCTLAPASIVLSSTARTGSSALSCTGSALFGVLGPTFYTVTVTGTGATSGKTHSTTFSVTVQDFTISASPTSVSPTVGVAGTSSISVGFLPAFGNRFSGTVSFAVTTNSTNLVCSVNPTSVSFPYSPATLSCTGSVAGNYNATVTGTSSILSHSVSVIYHVLATDFTVSTSPTSATVFAGQAATTTVNATGLNGFAHTVNLSYSASVSCGPNCTQSLTCTLTPTSIVLSSTTKTGFSTLSCTGNALFGLLGPSFYTVTVTGTGATSGKTHSTAFTVTVEDFGLSASPTSISPTVGIAGTSTITVGALPVTGTRFSGTVSLTVTTNSTSLTCFLNPTSLSFPYSGGSTLSCTGSNAGNYNATVTGNSSSLSHSVSIIYHVLATDFTIAVNPTSATVLAGQPATTNVNATGLNGFSDTVNLSYSASVSCGPSCTQSLTCTITPSSIVLSSTSKSGISILSCSGSALFGLLGPSFYTVTVTGTGATSGKTHSTTFTVTVTDFTISASPTSVSPVVSVAGTSSITIGSLPVSGNRFTGTVSLAVTTNSTNLVCSVNPTSVSFPYSPATLSCTGSIAGNYNATVSGTSSSLSHSASVIYHVSTGIHTTTTAVSCFPSSVTVGQTTTCTVTVTDTSSTGATSPAGTVAFSTGGSGSFVPATGTCSLTADGANIAACAVVYMPTAVGSGSHSISAAYSGDSTHSSSSTTVAFVLAVARASPAIASTVSPASITIGGSAIDLATVSGGFNPTGSVTYSVYSDAACTSSAFSSANIPLGTSSTSFTPSAPGTYYWTARYNGDANNNPVTTACLAPNESLSVAKATPNLTTQIMNAASAPASTITVGSTATDQATLTGGYPSAGVTGSVTYMFSTNSNCLNGVAEGSVSVGTGNTLAPSNAVTPIPAGAYSFQATYSGDGNNNGIVSGCEQLTVSKATPTISSVISPASITVGGSAYDLASLSGGYSPSGNANYTAFSDVTCSTPVFTSNRIALGTPSGSFTPSTVGNYYWIAKYNGDANNNAASSSCGAAGENLTVQKATPTITTTTSGSSTTVGGSISDSASFVTGTVFQPSGTVDYALFTGSSSCSGVSSTISIVTISGGTIPNSRLILLNSTGTYGFEATYSGDANNNGASSGCETVIVSPSSDFTVGASPTSLTIQQPSSKPSLITISSINGFTGTVTLSATSSQTGLTLTLESSTVILNSGSPTVGETIVVHTSLSTTPGQYTVTVTATSGTITHTATITVTVTALPPPAHTGCGNEECSVQSNSTISTEKLAGNTLHLTFDGTAGTAGFANVTIPISDVPHLDQFKVFVDNNKLPSSDVTITSNSTDYFVYFTFTFHSPVSVDIQFTAPQNATNLTLGLDPTLLYMILAVVVAVVVVISAFAVVRRRGRNRPIK